jgi:hypothetical protein
MNAGWFFNFGNIDIIFGRCIIIIYKIYFI